MKIARFLFVIVLLASVVMIPTKHVAAAPPEPAPVVVVNAEPQMVPENGWVTVSVFFHPDATQKAQSVQAKIVMYLDHPELIKNVQIIQGNLVPDMAKGTLTWTGVLWKGSLGETLKVKIQVGTIPPGSLPIGTNVLPVHAFAVVSDPVHGSIPTTTGSAVFNIYQPTIPGLVIDIGVDPDEAIAGDPVAGKLTFTVTFATTPAMLRDVNVNLVISFANAALVDQLTLIAPSPSGAKVVGKTVTYQGKLSGTGAQPVVIKFTAVAVAPAGVANVAGVDTQASTVAFKVNGVADAATATIEVDKTSGYINYLPNLLINK